MHASTHSVFQHILVVDDDPIQREVVAAHLVSRLSCRATQAGDGAEAKRTLGELGSEIDLIITDINMPDCDGPELIAHLRTAGARCPLVIVSGAAKIIVTSTTVLAQAYGLDVLGAMSKPLRYDALDELLEAAAQRKNAT